MHARPLAGSGLGWALAAGLKEGGQQVSGSDVDAPLHAINTISPSQLEGPSIRYISIRTEQIHSPHLVKSNDSLASPKPQPQLSILVLRGSNPGVRKSMGTTNTP